MELLSNFAFGVNLRRYNKVHIVDLSGTSLDNAASVGALEVGPADFARHIIHTHYKAWFVLSQMATYDVASNFFQAHCPPRHRQALLIACLRHYEN
jgi:hypothetical protein